MARDEQAQSLSDIIFRRAGLGWSEGLSAKQARNVAEAVSDVMGWNEVQISQEVEKYLQYLVDYHLEPRDEG